MSDNTDYTGSLVALVVVIVVGTIILHRFVYASITVVRHSEVMIVERFGRFNRVLKPGLHWVWPIMERTRHVKWRYREADGSDTTRVVSLLTDRIDMREHLIDLGDQSVITRDTVQLQLDALVYFRISDPQRAVYQVANLPDAIELLTQSTLRNIIASLTLDDTFSSREQINSELLAKVQRDCERWGVTIARVEVFNISPPDDILDAMTKQITAERDRRSTVLTADGERESSVILSRGQAAKLVLEAEGVRAATVLRAKGTAEAKKLMAAAEAQCLLDIRTATTPFRVRGVDYLTAVEYLNSLGRLMTGGSADKAVMVPLDSVDVMRHVLDFARGGNGQPPPPPR